jgi:hypothetical protein
MCGLRKLCVQENVLEDLEIFLFAPASRPALESTRGSYPVGTGALLPQIKRPGREAHHFPPRSVEVRNAWS